MIKRLYQLSIISMCLFLFSGCGIKKHKLSSERAVKVFHDQMDNKEFDKIYTTSDNVFQKAQTKDKTIAFLKMVRKKLGKLKFTSLKQWRVNSHNLTTYVILVYSTTFENGKGTETFSFVISGRKAVLRGYNINSQDLIMK